MVDVKVSFIIVDCLSQITLHSFAYSSFILVQTTIDVVLSANDIGPFKYGEDYSSSLGYTPSASLKWGDTISAITITGTPLYEYMHENQEEFIRYLEDII